MNRISSLIILTSIFFSFQNCSPYHAAGTLDSLTSNGAPAGQTLIVDQNLQTQSLAILSSKCASCHENITSGGITQILDVNHLIAIGLIVVGDPTQGRLIGAIQAGTMPVGGTVAAADLTTLKNWISSMHYVGSGTIPPVATQPLPAGKVVLADMTLHTQAMKIINSNCAGCHQGMVSGGIDNILDINNLVGTGLVVAGDSTKGRFLGAIMDATMPKGNGANVTAADLQTLKNWINSMTIVDQSLQPTPLPTRPALDSTFTAVFANVIQPKCIACHGPVKASSINLNSYTSVKNSAADISSKCQSGSMPQSPYPMVTTAELAALKTWIQNGALNN